MTSLGADGDRRMAGIMPGDMRAISTVMHHGARRFALIAQAALVNGDLARVLDAPVEVTQQCVACHAGYRLADAP